MEAVMGSSSPCLKLSSRRDERLRFSSLSDDFFAKVLKRSPIHHLRNHNNNQHVDLKLSLSFSSSRRAVRPVFLSSSHTQAEVENHELQLEQAQDGYINEAGLEAEQQMIRVTIQLQRECSFGQNFLIVGDDPMIGLWDPSNAIPLTWSDGHFWTVDLDIPVGKCIKFKFIMQETNGKLMWQPGPDRVLEFWETEKTITLCEDWENPDSRRVIEADPTLNQAEEITSEVKISSTDEPVPPKGYAINLKEMLASEEGMPVLVPGVSPLPKMDQDGSIIEAPKGEPESVNGANVAQELKMPEVNA